MKKKSFSWFGTWILTNSIVLNFSLMTVSVPNSGPTLCTCFPAHSIPFHPLFLLNGPLSHRESRWWHCVYSVVKWSFSRFVGVIIVRRSFLCRFAYISLHSFFSLIHETFGLNWWTISRMFMNKFIASSPLRSFSPPPFSFLCKSIREINRHDLCMIALLRYERKIKLLSLLHI